MSVHELPARAWRRRHLRILASRKRRRDAAELTALRRQPIHPAHERWLRHRAVGGVRCSRMSRQDILDTWQRWNAALEAVADRAVTPTVILVDDPVTAAAAAALPRTEIVEGPVGELCLRCGCLPGRADSDCPDPCPCHDGGRGVS